MPPSLTTSGADNLLDSAIERHKNGDVAGAICDYEKFLEKTPHHAGALNLLGLAFVQKGDGARAVPLLKQALTLRPDLPGADYNLAIVLQGLQRYDEAVPHFEKVLALNSRDVEAHFNLALALTALNQTAGATVHFKNTVALRPDHADAHFNLAKLLLADKNFESAVLHYRSALSRDQKLIEAYLGLATALRELRRTDEAIEVFRQAVAVAPQNAEAHCHFGAALHDAKRFSEALEHHETAIAMKPDLAEAHYNLASSCYALRQYSVAGSHYRTALALKLPPDLALKAELNFAFILQILGRYEEADRIFDKIIATHGDDMHGLDARQAKGMLYLGIGNFAQGWPLYEFRHSSTAPNVRENLKPRWQGEAVEGTLWVWGEQGLGDQILHASMVGELRQSASTVVLEVEPRLVGLFSRSFPGIHVVAFDSTVPQEQVQAQIPIASLGRYLRPAWESFPRREHGYLVADAARTAELRARLAGSGEKIVGLSWRSVSPKAGQNKSAQLVDFLPVLRQPGIRFIDLQYGDTSEERAALERATGIVISRLDDIDNTNDIDGLAALMGACDAVVTVSNTTAHLAGALGRPTWVFVPFGFAQIWYWFLDKNQSPWYPRVEVRRQIENQPWQMLISSTATETAAFLEMAGRDA
jgi:tetratricopeptide (TPR) repeat protein